MQVEQKKQEMEAMTEKMVEDMKEKNLPKEKARQEEEVKVE